MSCTAAKTGKQRFVKSRTPSTRRPASGSVALAGPRLRLDLRPYESFGQEPVAVDGTVLVDGHRRLCGVADAGLEFGDGGTVLTGEHERRAPRPVNDSSGRPATSRAVFKRSRRKRALIWSVRSPGNSKPSALGAV